MALDLEDVNEQSVLTLHFRFNSDLVVDLDGRVLGIIGSVSRLHSHVYPLVDLYGKVCQVSVLLHPYSITSGTSLDLPIIAENRREETLAELELEQETENRLKRKNRAYSQNNLVEDFESPQPGSSFDVGIPDNEVRKDPIPGRVMHQSLILPQDNKALEYRCVQKSHSTHNFSTNEYDGDIRAPRSENRFCDTNIQHNDRYPEANDVDNLDNEIMDALTLETGNLPDLTEEQSSSLDESTRRDDTSELLSVENLNYLNRILCLDQESEGSLESEWEAFGEGCEHLHLVLKYWNFLVLPYPELRRAVSWGQVKCYCSNCVPDAEPPFAGWVRIERIDGVGAATRGFWHVARSTLGAAQAAERAPARRPRALAPSPAAAAAPHDVWLDEEGKPHYTVLAIEIDIEGSEADKDRLLAFLIYMKSHVAFVEDNPSSLDE